MNEAPFILEKMGKALDLPESVWTEKEILDHVIRLRTRFQEMCGNLRAVVEKYHLGLGGEHIDELVIAELHRLKGGKQ